MHTTLFPTAYFAPVQYYWHWNRSERKIMDADENYLKQTWRNRCVIATGNGPMTLSLPVLGRAEKTAIRDVRLSDHGNWRHLHWNSIESAYRSSPFFEYYADDLRPFFEKQYPFLLDFNEEIREKICELLEIDAQCRQTETYLPEQGLPDDWLDLRNSMHPKKACPDSFVAKTYYQVFDRRFGFQANLSVLDLLCNMGPESILYL
jgi:hypothetical protein